MNISTRITKLENALEIKEAANIFCQCFEKSLAEYVDQIYSNPAFVTSPTDKPFADVCARCHKPTSEKDCKLYHDIKQIYG